MKNTLILLFITVQIIIAQTPQVPPGSGTSESPYQIEDLNNLYWIAATDAEVSFPTQAVRWSSHYIQKANINASSTSTWFSSTGWQSIGSSSNHFTGSYNGQGYAISGLTISTGSLDYKGLFGYTDGAVISNLNLTSTNIVGKNYVGALIGYCKNSQVSNCSSGGTIVANNLSGGGLIGATSNSPVSKCYSSCGVGGGYFIGGLVGSNSGSSISGCYATGNVNCSADNSGGLVGNNHNSSSISDCYATGNVTKTGGSSWNFAGFIGANSATISNCYSIGDVDASAQTNKGFAGSNNSIIQNCFWDGDESNQETDYWATKKTTVEMKTASTFLEAGWDPAIWNIEDGINNGYPYLDWQNSGGTPLPVELTLFSANVVDNKIILNWQTATEVNNYGFEIERATVISIPNDRERNLIWEKIGFVQGHGNSNSPKSYSFTDAAPPCGKIQYRLKQIDTDGTYEYYGTIAEIDMGITGVQENEAPPSEFALMQNYPNPFNPSTVISYQLPVAGHVALKVFDLLGREVASLVNEHKAPGNYKVTFDGSELASGVYFYKLETENGFNAIKKLVLLR